MFEPRFPVFSFGSQMSGPGSGLMYLTSAVPSVVPITATDYFHKTECFCFESQVLEPGEEMELPLRFIVDAGLPKNVQSISLSYALFDATGFAAAEQPDT